MLVHECVPPRTSGAMHRQAKAGCSTLHRLSKCPWLLQRRSHLALRRRGLSQGSLSLALHGTSEGRQRVPLVLRRARGYPRLFTALV